MCLMKPSQTDWYTAGSSTGVKEKMMVSGSTHSLSFRGRSATRSWSRSQYCSSRVPRGHSAAAASWNGNTKARTTAALTIPDRVMLLSSFTG